MNDRLEDGLPPGHTLGSLLHRIAARVSHHGPWWLIRRSIEEIRRPYTPLGRAVNAAMRKASSLRGGLFMRRSAENAPADVLLAVYDLLIEPSTFDVIWFLMMAELERRRRGLSALHVVFAGEREGEQSVRSDYAAVIDRSARKDRILNLLVPLAWAVPSVTNVEVLYDRRMLRARLRQWRRPCVFPEDFSVDFHRSFVSDCVRGVHRLGPGEAGGIFRASDAALAAVDRWLAARAGNKPVVSITVRHYRYMPARNSNMAAWADTARYLTERGYFPVFIPDTDSFGEPPPVQVATFPHLGEASWALHLRLALYQRAFLNLGINNGPAHLFIVSDRCRGLMFKMLTPGVPQAEASYIASQGFTVGGQLPFRTPFQKWVWEDDDFDVIKREFEAMEQQIRHVEASTRGENAAGS